MTTMTPTQPWLQIHHQPTPASILPPSFTHQLQHLQTTKGCHSHFWVQQRQWAGTTTPLGTHLPCYITTMSANITTTTMNGGNDDSKQLQDKGDKNPGMFFAHFTYSTRLIIPFTVPRTKGVQMMKRSFIILYPRLKMRLWHISSPWYVSHFIFT